MLTGLSLSLATMCVDLIESDGDYTVPVSWDEILPGFPGSVTNSLVNYFRLNVKSSSQEGGSLFCTVGISLYQDEIFSCNRFSTPKPDEKIN